MAGAQLRNVTPKEALELLKKAIDEYIEESNITLKTTQEEQKCK